MFEHAYRYQILHKPDLDLIHVKLWEEGTLLLDTGDVFDSSNSTLRGGRLGVFCMSQEDITWSALSYRLDYCHHTLNVKCYILDASDEWIHLI